MVSHCFNLHFLMTYNVAWSRVSYTAHLLHIFLGEVSVQVSGPPFGVSLWVVVLLSSFYISESLIIVFCKYFTLVLWPVFPFLHICVHRAAFLFNKIPS